MKVLMVSKALIVSAYHAKVRRLAELGVDIDLVIPKKWGKKLPEKIVSKDYRVHKLDCVFHGYNHFHFYLGLKNIIDNVSPDIIHVDEEPYSFVTYQVMRLAENRGIKRLFFTWQNIYKKYPFPFSYIERYNFDASDIAIAGNNDAKDVLFKKGYKKGVVVIPQFGTDVKIFRKIDVSNFKKRFVPDTSLFVIGYIGRIIKEKGLSTLLHAINILRNGVYLIIVGGGPYLKVLNQIIEKLGLQNRVKVIKEVPSTDVPKYMNCFDCFVLPSITTRRVKEQFGRVLVEAMACEVPVIGSSSGEIPNVIKDVGLVFKEGDANDLASKVQMLIENRRLREDLSKRGRRRVVENFSNDRIAKATLDVYKKLVTS